MGSMESLQVFQSYSILDAAPTAVASESADAASSQRHHVRLAAHATTASAANTAAVTTAIQNALRMAATRTATSSESRA